MHKTRAHMHSSGRPHLVPRAPAQRIRAQQYPDSSSVRIVSAAPSIAATLTTAACTTPADNSLRAPPITAEASVAALPNAAASSPSPAMSTDRRAISGTAGEAGRQSHRRNLVRALACHLIPSHLNRISSGNQTCILRLCRSDFRLFVVPDLT